jgi:hypothetical protein
MTKLNAGYLEDKHKTYIAVNINYGNLEYLLSH